jgi:cytosine/adenosine deaminase-related metal-dependent hydrolase
MRAQRISEYSFVLTGGWVALGAREAVRADLEVADGLVVDVRDPASRKPVRDASFEVDINGHLILPGLINAHDHLEFSLYPRLGRGPYANSEEWARDIYHPDRSPVREHRSVPKTVRLLWGGIKNLLSGVTRVCHHNVYDDGVFGGGFPVHVLRRYGWAHSLVFEKDVAGIFRSTPPEVPFIIHLGEGTDVMTGEEVFALDRMGALDHRTVLVHCVGLTSEGHELRRRKGASLIWCPTSNRFLLGTTLDAAFVSSGEPMALGSDSPLTAHGDLLDEIRAAYERERVSADVVYSMVTRSSAAVLRLGQDAGQVRCGARADLTVVPWTERTPSETLVRADRSDIEMVLVDGHLQLVSSAMAEQWPAEAVKELEWIEVGGVQRRVQAPVRWMIGETVPHLGRSLQLAGREVVH